MSSVDRAAQHILDGLAGKDDLVRNRLLAIDAGKTVFGRFHDLSDLDLLAALEVLDYPQHAQVVGRMTYDADRQTKPAAKKVVLGLLREYLDEIMEDCSEDARRVFKELWWRHAIATEEDKTRKPLAPLTEEGVRQRDQEIDDEAEERRQMYAR